MTVLHYTTPTVAYVPCWRRMEHTLQYTGMPDAQIGFTVSG